MKTKKLRPVMKIHGGKYYLSQWVIDNFPKDYQKMTYCELFGGAASVLLNKAPSSKEIYNDLHSPTANIFHCLVNCPQDLINKITQIKYNEDSFKLATTIPFKFGNVESAVAELVLRRMSRGGMKKAFSWSERLRGGRPGDLNAWETFKDQILLIAQRIKGVEVFNFSAIDLISKYISDPSILLYLDPPYVAKTRTAKSVYDCEMNNKDHKFMASLIKDANCKVVVSGYENDLYSDYFKNWNRVLKEVPNNSGQGKKKQRRVEILWKNY